MGRGGGRARQKHAGYLSQQGASGGSGYYQLQLPGCLLPQGQASGRGSWASYCPHPAQAPLHQEPASPQAHFLSAVVRAELGLGELPGESCSPSIKQGESTSSAVFMGQHPLTPGQALLSLSLFLTTFLFYGDTIHMPCTSSI